MILYTAICCLCMWCFDQTKKTKFERDTRRSWIFIRFQSTFLAAQTWISKCQLPSVKSVQPASNQSLHAKANITWQLSNPCGMSSPHYPSRKAVYCSQLCMRSLVRNGSMSIYTYLHGHCSDMDRDVPLMLWFDQDFEMTARLEVKKREKKSIIVSVIVYAKPLAISLYKSKESLSVCLCVCVCVCVCVPQISRGSRVCDICLDCSEIVNKLFHKCFTNSASIVHQGHHSYMCTRANHCRAQATTYLTKQADLYLQQRELDRDFAGSSVPFCSVHLN